MHAGPVRQAEHRWIAAVLFAIAGVGSAAGEEFPIPAIPCAPREYVCSWTAAAPAIDGAMEDPAWQAAPWTEAFVDIEGPLKPLPRYRTRVKMLWDDACFYIAAEMEEPDLWATYREHDSVIFHENDFELFIDPDGDTHEYYELEINALGTVWDLLLIRPYRDGGPAVNGWEIAGLRTAVKIDGSLNDPADRDQGWTVEIALPWQVLAECAHRPAPPREGDRWRVNFSRVEWRLEVRDGGYVKQVDPATGRSLPEDNWVWSPQGLIAMHYPEMWGVVLFTRGGAAADRDPETDAAWALRRVYYAQKQREAQSGLFAPSLDDLRFDPPLPAGMQMWSCRAGFEAVIPAPDGRSSLAVGADGRLRRIAAGQP